MYSSVNNLLPTNARLYVFVHSDYIVGFKICNDLMIVESYFSFNPHNDYGTA